MTSKTEIEKLYNNAGLSNLWVERYSIGNGIENEVWHNSYNDMISTMMKNNGWTKKEAVEVAKRECKKEFPEFTPKKQLELIKLITQKCELVISKFGRWEFTFYDGYSDFNAKSKDFSDALALLINTYWENLTEREQLKIKEILSED